jgi:hypothetical protein
MDRYGKMLFASLVVIAGIGAVAWRQPEHLLAAIGMLTAFYAALMSRSIAPDPTPNTTVTTMTDSHTEPKPEVKT